MKFFMPKLIHSLHTTLSSVGFEIKQWASNDTKVICELPHEARSEQTEIWLSHHPSLDPLESTQGLLWNCLTDNLRYRHRAIGPTTPTMRHLYRVLASQYDPLGYILPYTTRAKIIVQHLWGNILDWDDPNLIEAWLSWESELPSLSTITLPHCFTPQSVNPSSAVNDLHFFCDASAVLWSDCLYAYRRSSAGECVLPYGKIPRCSLKTAIHSTT